MSKQDEAGLILKLYELRRDETMRKARDWFVREFHPKSVGDYMNTMAGPHTGHLRMVVSYWDMAAALVNNGAISLELFDATNGEHILVFSRIEPLLPEIRKVVGPQFGANLEKLIDETPHGRKKVAENRERMKAFLEEATKQAQAAS